MPTDKVGELVASEKLFENKLKRWLESRGIYPLGTDPAQMNAPPTGYWLKRWGGGQYTKAGLPDMQIVIKGVCVEAELKAPNGRPSELQKQKLKQINQSGGIGFILYPKDFDNFKKFVIELEKGNVDNANELFKGRLV